MMLSLEETHERINGINKKFGTNYKFELPNIYTGIHMKILAECEFGHQFQISIDNAYRGKGCPKCANNKTAERCRFSWEQALSKLINVWGDTYEFLNIDQYHSAHEKLAVRCKKSDHGVFYASYANLYSGKGCPKCRYDTIADKRRLSSEKALSNIKSVHGEKYEYPYIHYEYHGAYSKLTATCPLHGEFSIDYDHLMQGNGCAECGKETIARAVRNIMNMPGVADYERYHSKMLIDDNPTCGFYGELLVRCKLCGKMFVPKLRAVLSRITAINSLGNGENNFYCSDECKEKCTVFGKRSDTHILAQQIDNYEAKVKLARNCQLETKRILRQQQIDQFGYHFCEKCGEAVDNPDLHHTIEVAKDPSGAITIAGQMLVCVECHKEFTIMCR